MRLGKGPWGFGAGIVLGFVVGSISLATAEFGYKGWHRLGRDFQVGYLTGFMDMARLARNLDPGGFIDEHYPTWPKMTLAVWHNAVNEVYKIPENQQYGMYAAVQLAAKEIEKKFGPAPTAVERLAPAFKQRVEAARKAEQAKRAALQASGQAAPAVAAPRPEPAAASQTSSARRNKRRGCPCPDAGEDRAAQPKAAEAGPAAAAGVEPAEKTSGAEVAPAKAAQPSSKP